MQAALALEQLAGSPHEDTEGLEPRDDQLYIHSLGSGYQEDQAHMCGALLPTCV